MIFLQKPGQFAWKQKPDLLSSSSGP